MGVFQAIGKGVKIAGRLWFAIPAVVVSYSAIGALATVWLPFSVVDGRLQVPPPATAEEALSQLMIGMGLFLCSGALSLYWLGGTLGSARQLLRDESFSRGVFFETAGRFFFRMLRWTLAWACIVMGSGLGVAVLIGFFWAVTGRSPAMKILIQFGFTAATLLAAVSLLFSPMILLENGQGVWASLKDSWRFIRAHAAGAIRLLGSIVLVGVMVWTIGLILGAGVGQLHQMMGMTSFTKGWPAFFFGLILGLPQAFLTLFIPAALYAYYRGNTRT